MFLQNFSKLSSDSLNVKESDNMKRKRIVRIRLIKDFCIFINGGRKRNKIIICALERNNFLNEKQTRILLRLPIFYSLW